MTATVSMPDVQFCSSCIFWVPAQRDDKGNPVIGECRRNPPQAFIINGPPGLLGQPSQPQIVSQFPPTQAGSYCGEHDSGIDEDVVN